MYRIKISDKPTPEAMALRRIRFPHLDHDKPESQSFKNYQITDTDGNLIACFRSCSINKEFWISRVCKRPGDLSGGLPLLMVNILTFHRDSHDRLKLRCRTPLVKYWTRKGFSLDLYDAKVDLYEMSAHFDDVIKRYADADFYSRIAKIESLTAKEEGTNNA